MPKKQRKPKTTKNVPIMPVRPKKPQSAGYARERKRHATRRRKLIDDILARTRASRAELDAAAEGADLADVAHLEAIVLLPVRTAKAAPDQGESPVPSV